MRILVIVAMGLLAAACSRQNDRSTIMATMRPPPAAMSTPTPSPSGSAEHTGLPPVSGSTPRYVGRWAATRQLCESGAWRFHTTHLETAGGTSCSYPRVYTVPGGYDLHAACIVGGPPHGDVIKLRFAESAQAMLVESKVLPSIGLIYCGPLE